MFLGKEIQDSRPDPDLLSLQLAGLLNRGEKSDISRPDPESFHVVSF